jgi:hypothetical protein
MIDSAGYQPFDDTELEAKLRAGGKAFQAWSDTLTKDPERAREIDLIVRRGRFLATLAALRDRMRRAAADGRFTQAWVGARMGTAQPNVGRLESGNSDPHISTLERYLATLDCDLELRVYDADHQLVAATHTEPSDRPAADQETGSFP